MNDHLKGSKIAEREREREAWPLWRLMLMLMLMMRAGLVDKFETGRTSKSTISQMCQPHLFWPNLTHNTMTENKRNKTASRWWCKSPLPTLGKSAKWATHPEFRVCYTWGFLEHEGDVEATKIQENVRKTNLSGGNEWPFKREQESPEREREREAWPTVEIDDAGDDESRLARQVWNGEELQNSSPKFAGM